MLKCVLFYILIFFCFKSTAQVVIKGSIKDEKKTGLSFASITAENPLDTSIVAYTISDENGIYSLSINSKLSKFMLRMKKFNFDSETIMINNISQTINFIAKPNVIQLKEVNIKQPPITKRNDTLNYNLNSFANSQDRTLGDVLKKIPGIDVNANGQIRYQGRPINNFYVEGKDLMGGSYGVITNSLPNIDVSTVQVLQNYQPVKVLKDKVYSPDAALNIKLKKNITVTGRGEFGIGLSPLLWQTKLTPMLFNKKYQALFSYKSNNIGEDILSELENLNLANGKENVTMNNMIGNWLGVAEASLPSIDQKRYLFNKTHTVSGNILFNVSKNLELKTNISYLNDIVDRQGIENGTIKQYDNGLNNVLFTRFSNAELKNQRLRGIFSLTENTPTFFFKNNLIIQREVSSALGILQLNSLPINQNLNLPSYYLENNFTTILPIGKNKMLTIQSLIKYGNDKQTYIVSPLNALRFEDPAFLAQTLLNQNLIGKNLSSINSIATSFSIKNLTITPKIGIDLSNNDLNTKLGGIDTNNNKSDFGINYNNDIKYFSLVSKGVLEINYIGDKLKLKAINPIKINHIKVDAPANDFFKQKNKLTFEPIISLQYKFSASFKLTSTGFIGRQFSSIENIYPSYIFSNLDFTAFNSNIDEIKAGNTSTSINYENVLTNVFASATYSFSKQQNYVVVNTKILPNGQRVLESINKENNSNRNFYSLNIGKFLPTIKTNIVAGYTINSSNNNTYFNSKIVPIKISGQTFRFKVNYNQFNWLGINYQLIYFLNKQKSFNTTINSNKILNYIETFVVPIKNHSLTVLADVSTYKLNSQKYKNPFLDFRYQYTLEKKKIDFEIKWVNILNSKFFEQIDVGEIQTTQTQFKIRPSQVLFSAKFNFR